MLPWCGSWKWSIPTTTWEAMKPGYHASPKALAMLLVKPPERASPPHTELVLALRDWIREQGDHEELEPADETAAWLEAHRPDLLSDLQLNYSDVRYHDY